MSDGRPDPEVTGAWDYRLLPENVQLGADCYLERRGSWDRFRSQRVPGCVLGDRVRAFTWTTFNVDEGGFLEVGDETVLVGAVFMCADHIRIGAGAVISYGVTIADSDFHPRDGSLRRQDAVANAPGGDRRARPPIETRPVDIGDGAHIGIGAIVLKGVRIGEDARVGAGAVVTSDVPAGATVAGNPARRVDPSGGVP